MNKVLNLDGLVGPSHNYGGLAVGNLASASHKGTPSSPKQAALQGLEKMWALARQGLPQGFIPPQPRPNLDLLRAAGFRGSDSQLIDQAYLRAPELLEICYSASAMWAANSATITAAQDSDDKRLQITPANLISALHRSQEAETGSLFFSDFFANEHFFQVHQPLPAQDAFADEGAANHIRLSDPDSSRALNLFVFGRDNDQSRTTRFPARQSKLASESIIRKHQVKETAWLLVRQNPEAIDGGAFHNDVVAVGLDNFLLIHEQAFHEQAAVMDEIRKRCQLWRKPLIIFEVSQRELSLDDAVKSYLFNSQLVVLSDGGMLLLAPQESADNPNSAKICRQILEADNPVSAIEFFDLKQSMRNGGGPACLRLSIPIDQQALDQINPAIMLSEANYTKLKQFINQYYRDRLSPDDLRDPLLVEEMHTAMSAINTLIKG